ncbi:hypothetical protein C882_1994 [Caenispirillum salinarum AK4]|uniref:Uncharacterized protein n=1 Tax=Caenispirillum salinarum AK4 TaxID=1238182 RepID=K9GM27_9PROT|nr:hypothetical protein [Caenispirillum salinarum]EKV27065.1 hypothetical protein C882_1994 [Caenispirillum salinarum AK4]
MSAPASTSTTAAPRDLDGLKGVLAARLPARAAAAVADYEAFAGQAPPDDAKGFAAHHAACKAALAHVEAAVKLLRWAAPPEPAATAPDPEADDLARLIAEARAALSEDSDPHDHPTARPDPFAADDAGEDDTDEEDDA